MNSQFKIDIKHWFLVRLPLGKEIVLVIVARWSLLFLHELTCAFLYLPYQCNAVYSAPFGKLQEHENKMPMLLNKYDRN